MVTAAAPCESWAAVWPCDIDCLSPLVTGQALAMATEVVWALSGRRFGTCTTTIRPCRRDCGDWSWYWTGDSYGYPFPALIGGQWYNLACGLCGDSCSCSELCQVKLPGIVTEIVSVVVDGSPLVTGAYRVDNGNVLVRTDGGCFPWCNDLSKPPTQVGTWAVTAKYGVPVPPGGNLAVGELACEFAKALANEPCRLPRGVQSVQRQGVTINYGKLMEEGSTGFYLIDVFVQTYNPGKLTTAPHVWNVDAPVPRVQTWP